MKTLKRVLEKYIYPCILLLYPLLKINQGIDLTDTCYGLVNYHFFPNAGREWTVATYLANALGAALMRLPFGESLIGIRFYTGLIVSAMALLSWYFLKGKMPAWIAFAGEIAAISLCWIPTTSLYNYLTFALFLFGSVSLYRGLIWQRRSLMALAGIFLGANVITRVPNAVECLMIIAVFYYGAIKKKRAKEIWKDVGACAAGYIGAFLIGFAVICIQFGPSAYGEMLAGLSGYQTTDQSYSVFSMIAAIMMAYISSFKWVFLLLAAAVLGRVLFVLEPQKFKIGKKIIFLCMLPVLLRLLWGRGMFNFQYKFYWSVYEWFMVFLYAALGFCIWALLSPRVFRRDKLLSLMVLLIIMITPVGSNNGTYPVMNNLFLAAPVTLWFGYRCILTMRGKDVFFPYRAMLTAAAAVFFIQSLGFGFVSVFRDSIDGEKRDSQVTGSPALTGVYTNAANAEALQDVVDYYNDNHISQQAGGGRRLITFGDVPGFNWILDMHSAFSHDWPDMDTYPAARMKEELTYPLKMSVLSPLVILCPEQVDFQNAHEAEKWALLMDYLDEAGGYSLKLDNGVYQIYDIR